MLSIVLAVVAAVTETVRPIDKPLAPAVQVRLAAGSPVFAGASEVRLQLAIENVGSGCYPILIDPTFQPIESNRPSLLLHLSVYDVTQRVVPRQNAVGSDLRGFRASDLLVLNCGAFYGRYLDLAKPDWSYNLGRGTYRVRARVTSRVGSFVKRSPDLLGAIESAVGLSSKSVAHMLVDWMKESNDVVFEVR